MSVIEVIIRAVILGLLVSYLVSKHRQRVRHRPVKLEDPALWTGKGIDASTLIPTIDRVRHDYLAVRRSPARDFRDRKGLLAIAERAIVRLSFFQKTKLEEDARKHAT